MAASSSVPHEKSFSVHWKIKNFTYCYETISSPEFRFAGCLYYLQLQLSSTDLECVLKISETSKTSCLYPAEVSFLTCDASPEESNSKVYLKVPKDVIFIKRVTSFLPEDTLTVRLRIFDNVETRNVFFNSEIGVRRHCFLWTFENFSAYKDKVEKSVLYGDIKLNFKFMNRNSNWFYIQISRKDGEKCYCILKTSILNVDGKDVNEVKDEFVFEKKDGEHICRFPTTYDKSKLLKSKNLLLPNDTLSLKCDFVMSLGRIVNQKADVNKCENIKPFSKEYENFKTTLSIIKEKEIFDPGADLQADLENILKDETLTDVSLQSGTTIVKAHKSILSARSTVFKAMFTKDMKEAANNTVLIEDLDQETVSSLIIYIYTNTIHEYEWEKIKKLYYAADKYQIQSLKKKCVSFLSNNLSISKVCEALSFADLHLDGDLTKATKNFISKNDYSVFTSEEWKELGKNNPSLALQVMNEFYINNNVNNRV